MNTINNDKLLSHNAAQRLSHGDKASNTPDKLEGHDKNQKGKDSLDLSPAGQQLSAPGRSDAPGSTQETPEQAKTLVDKIRNQFEQSGVQALNAHSSVQVSHMDLLHRTMPA